MRILPLVVALATLAALAPIPSAGASCHGTSPSIPLAANGKTYHVATNGFAVYQESNNIGGLQRRDGDHNDTCMGLINPDTLIVGLL